MRNAFRALEAVEIDEGITAEDHQDFVDAEKMVGKAISAIDQAVRRSPDQERRRTGGCKGAPSPLQTPESSSEYSADAPTPGAAPLTPSRVLHPARRPERAPCLPLVHIIVLTPALPLCY